MIKVDGTQGGHPFHEHLLKQYNSNGVPTVIFFGYTPALQKPRSPDNGQFESLAVVTESKNWAPDDLLSFMAGRSAQENTINELKTSFAFDQFPTNTYQANSAYQQLSQMAYNLSISMQHGMGLATKRNCGKKLICLYCTHEWRTLRFTLLNRAGRMVTLNGRKPLLVSKNEATRSLYYRIASALVDVSRKLGA
jgi:hypothetical protein